MEPGPHTQIVAAAAFTFCRFPFEAIQQSGEAARFRQPDEILHLPHGILEARGNDLEVLGVRRGQCEFRHRHADCRSISAPTPESFSSNRSKPRSR